MPEKRPIHILTPEEVRRIIDQCSRRAPSGLRDAALIAVLYRCGLRVSEALALRESDLNADRGTLRVTRGKGGASRTVGIDQTAVAMVERWIAAKRKRGIPRASNLFCTLDGNPVASTSNVRGMLRRRARKAGIEKRVHPHGLRHTHAMELIADEGIPLNALQKQLGHSSLATTSQYVDHLGASEVIEIGRKRPDW